VCVCVCVRARARALLCVSELKPVGRAMLYMPLLHAEDAALQAKSVELFEALYEGAKAKGAGTLSILQRFHVISIRHKQVRSRLHQRPSPSSSSSSSTGRGSLWPLSRAQSVPRAPEHHGRGGLPGRLIPPSLSSAHARACRALL